ncbi:hypothetical protein LTT66_22155 [Nocardia gipuzkoensis]|uniref:hypothetical protein n=1 Tax=Nocardia gipuzkoensis TaxID=2749991 RepID=UPI001E28420A|nr:hypothetical protein [Nocardia gipuzkoensis]UGT66009.1 hypothetical protein LTT66_22155 [Nocardia gipuzkoensis]
MEEVKELPDRLNRRFDELKWKLPGAYLALTDVRDAAQDNLKTLMSKLGDAVEGQAAPILFVGYAANWQQVGANVSKVNNTQNDPRVNLEGYWDGSAYKAFKTAQTYQAAAMSKITEMCEKVHDQLLIIAEEGRALYKQIIDKLGTLLGQAATALAESSTGVGIIWSINSFNDAIVTAVELVVEAMTSFLELQAKSVIASNELANIINHPAGFFPDSEGKDRWPSPQVEGYDSKEDDWKLDGAD